MQGMFDQDKANQVLERVANGESLSATARELKIGRRTVHDWREKDPEFAAQYARAKDAGFDAIADSLLEIADNGRNDWMERNGEDDAGWRANGEHIQRSKLRVETRLRLLKAWDPKRYGDRQAVELTGKDGADLFAGQSKDQLRAEILRRMSNPDLLRALMASGVLPDALQQALAKPDAK